MSQGVSAPADTQCGSQGYKSLLLGPPICVSSLCSLALEQSPDRDTDACHLQSLP